MSVIRTSSGYPASQAPFSFTDNAGAPVTLPHVTEVVIDFRTNPDGRSACVRVQVIGSGGAPTPGVRSLEGQVDLGTLASFLV